jgi:hypothetical protein
LLRRRLRWHCLPAARAFLYIWVIGFRVGAIIPHAGRCGRWLGLVPLNVNRRLRRHFDCRSVVRVVIRLIRRVVIRLIRIVIGLVIPR